MKAQTTAFLEAAQIALAKAKKIHGVNIPDEAARLAYFVQFHAAQAFIFERTGKIAKTHKGVRTQFHQLSRNDPATAEKGLAESLSTTYAFKQTADYEAGAIDKITPQHSARAIRDAERFLTAVTAALSPGSPNSPAP